jgi:nucleoid-associated protein EbfC
VSTPFEQAGLGGIFAEMQRLQEQLAAAEAASDATEVEGSSGGGAVRIKVSGEFSFSNVTIDKAVVADGDASIIEDLVLAALRDATTKLLEVRKAAMGQAVGGALSAMLGGEAGGLFGTAPTGEMGEGSVIELGFPDLGEN